MHGGWALYLAFPEQPKGFPAILSSKAMGLTAVSSNAGKSSISRITCLSGKTVTDPGHVNANMAGAMERLFAFLEHGQEFFVVIFLCDVGGALARFGLQAWIGAMLQEKLRHGGVAIHCRLDQCAGAFVILAVYIRFLT